MALFLNFELEETTESPTSAVSTHSIDADEVSGKESPLSIKKRKRSSSSIQIPIGTLPIQSDKPFEKKRKTSLIKTKSKQEMSLMNELENLEKMYKFTSEGIDLDTLETPNDSSLGKILVLASFPSSPFKLVFRIGNRLEYENVLTLRKDLEETDKDWKIDFETSGCGLEEVEVIDYGEKRSLVDSLKTFSKNVGVGLTGNRVQISDIVKFVVSLE
jgi:hypothetical protein